MITLIVEICVICIIHLTIKSYKEIKFLKSLNKSREQWIVVKLFNDYCTDDDGIEYTIPKVIVQNPRGKETLEMTVASTGYNQLQMGQPVWVTVGYNQSNDSAVNCSPAEIGGKELAFAAFVAMSLVSSIIFLVMVVFNIFSWIPAIIVAILAIVILKAIDKSKSNKNKRR
jgi:hypothetical protein